MLFPLTLLEEAMDTIAFWIGGTVAITLLTQLFRYLFFKKSSGYVRAVLPVLPAWLSAIPLYVLLGSIDQPAWGKAINGYTVPAIVVAAFCAVRERQKQRRVVVQPA